MLSAAVIEQRDVEFDRPGIRCRLALRCPAHVGIAGGAQRAEALDVFEREREIRGRVGALAHVAGHGLQGAVQQCGVEGEGRKPVLDLVRQLQSRQRFFVIAPEPVDGLEMRTVVELGGGEPCIAARLGHLFAAACPDRFQIELPWLRGSGSSVRRGVLQAPLGVDLRLAHGVFGGDFEGDLAARQWVELDPRRDRLVVDADWARPHDLVQTANRRAGLCQFARRPGHFQIGHPGQRLLPGDAVVGQVEFVAAQELAVALRLQCGVVAIKQRMQPTRAARRVLPRNRFHQPVGLRRPVALSRKRVGRQRNTAYLRAAW